MDNRSRAYNWDAYSSVDLGQGEHAVYNLVAEQEKEEGAGIGASLASRSISCL